MEGPFLAKKKKKTEKQSNDIQARFSEPERKYAKEEREGKKAAGRSVFPKGQGEVGKVPEPVRSDWRRKKKIPTANQKVRRKKEEKFVKKRKPKAQKVGNTKDDGPRKHTKLGTVERIGRYGQSMSSEERGKKKSCEKSEGSEGGMQEGS